MWLAVHEGGVSLLSPSSMDQKNHYSWSQLAAFGSDSDHLVMVVTSSINGSHDNTETEKLLFFMSKAKVSLMFYQKTFFEFPLLCPPIDPPSHQPDD